MNELMNDRMSEWMNEWMSKCMNQQANEWVNMNKLIIGWMNEQMDGRLNCGFYVDICSLLEDREVVLYCDLHGHSRHQNIFIYGCENRADTQRRLQERVFPYMLSRNAPDMFSYKTCRFHVQKNKEGTGRVVVWNMGVQNSYTLEVRTLPWSAIVIQCFDQGRS